MPKGVKGLLRITPEGAEKWYDRPEMSKQAEHEQQEWIGLMQQMAYCFRFRKTKLLQ